MTNPPCPRCGKECQPTDKDPVTYRCNAPKSDAKQITAEDVKEFLAWRKSKGFDPGTTLYTDRVILHNFFNRLKIDNPVKEVPKLPKFRKRPVAYADAELKRFFRVCDD